MRSFLAAAHLSARRVAVALVVAAVAAVGAGAYGASRPADYTARTTVWVTRVLPPTAGGDVSSSIDDFEATLKLVDIEDAVSKATGEARLALQTGITFERIGQSSADTVVYTSTSRSVAADVVTLAARDALAEIARQALAGAQAQTGPATDALTTARAALDAYDRSVGVADVGQAFADGQRAISAISAQISTVPPAALPALEAALQTAQAKQTALADQLPRYQQLAGAVTQATTALALATSAVTAAQAASTAATAADVVTPVTTRADSTVSGIAVPATVAFLAGLAAVVGGLYAVDLLAGRRDRVGRGRVQAPLARAGR